MSLWFRRLRLLAPILASVPVLGVAETGEFSLAAAQKLADARRREQHGDCGTCVFKERIGDAWVFRTWVGYGGAPAPDIVVVPPADAGSLSREMEPSLNALALPVRRAGTDAERVRPLSPSLAERTSYWRHAIILTDTVVGSSLRIVVGRTLMFGGPSILCARTSREGKIMDELFYTVTGSEIPTLREKDNGAVLQMPSGHVLFDLSSAAPLASGT
jgi:hypothetical protein